MGLEQDDDRTEFPRRLARTRRFTLGVPHAFTISPDGARVVFLRSGSGTDPVNRLWTLDLESATERPVAEPALLAGPDERAEDLPEAERVRRERARERAGGIVSYATDSAVRRAVFALAGRLFLADLETGTVREVAVRGPVMDPRLDPAGRRVAFVRAGGVHVADLTDHPTDHPTEDPASELTSGLADAPADAPTATERTLAAPENDDVTYGLAEHIAAENGWRRGFWWAPDGSRLLIARVDKAPVQRWHVADPANPELPPREIAYAAAGTANADVSLWCVDLDGERTQVEWDRAGFEYLIAVRWDRDPLLTVQSRDQRVLRLLRVDPRTGATGILREDRDDSWVTIIPGVPAQTGSGGLVWVGVDGDAYRLLRDGQPVTPPDLQVSEVLGVDGETVLMAASREPTQVHLWTHDPEAGLVRRTGEPGVYGGVRAGGVAVTTFRSLDHEGTRVSVEGAGRPIEVASHGAPLGLALNISLLRAGARELRTAVVLPSWYEPGSAGKARLPVLMSPYGGPALQVVTHTRSWAYGVAQWFAEHGFAVVIADGRGTPGRGPRWDRTVRGDRIGPVLDDQITALRVAADRHPGLDLDRVGVRGWSFGGYLAAAAVLRRPDVFHAAVAGAAPADPRLYDTHWMERYLGHPDEEPENYERCSLLMDVARLHEGPPDAAARRPLLLVHGLADDNVVVAHTLRLSTALLAAGHPHAVLPLPGVTHMVGQEQVTRNLLRAELHFLRQSLDVPDGPK